MAKLTSKDGTNWIEFKTPSGGQVVVPQASVVGFEITGGGNAVVHVAGGERFVIHREDAARILDLLGLEEIK